MTGDQGAPIASYSGESSYLPYENSGYVALRIMPERLMADIERFLSNKKYELQKVNGQLVEVARSMGSSLCNEQGINSILNLIRLRVNEHTVQGNFDLDQYNNYIADSRTEISEAIIANADVWEIKDTSIEMIINGIMGLLKPFLSRTIDNLERESLKTGMQSKETVVREVDRNGGSRWPKVN